MSARSSLGIVQQVSITGDPIAPKTSNICVQQTSNISSNRFEAPEKKVVDFVEKQAIIASVPRLFTRSSSFRHMTL